MMETNEKATRLRHEEIQISRRFRVGFLEDRSQLRVDFGITIRRFRR